MLPEDRLEEAKKQIGLARESETLTEQERQWLADAVRSVEAVEAGLQLTREQEEDTAVLDP
jgi:hypothetical protein